MERLLKIRRKFREYFGDTDYAELPENIRIGEIGEIDHIPQVGGVWCGAYKLCYENDQYYLDFYASHRQTNSRHIRIHEGGELEALEHFWEFGYIVYKDDPERTERERNEKILKNREVGKILRSKGLLR